MAAYNNSRDEDAAVALLCPGAGARTANAAANNSGAAYNFTFSAGGRTATRRNDGAADTAAAPTKNGAPPCISSGVRTTAAQDEDGTVYLDYDTPAEAARNSRHGAAVALHRLVADEVLPVASQVSGDKTASVVPAVAVGQGKVAGAFTELLRRGLPVLGLSVASLAVAGLAAGEPTPAAGFGLFLMLIVGLSGVTIRAIRA
ncbi:hypothetical protein PVAP13_6KG050370 [Panicum virgatum]|uniref:Uncharacterized protein n=1 Tax=Panicum virgatum TaxID=38727 RepID=A0A8T0R943_PANVG|nr:hypothetical protein PVAP13_6KG050370 [Panicum virgatum]